MKVIKIYIVIILIFAYAVTTCACGSQSTQSVGANLNGFGTENEINMVQYSVKVVDTSGQPVAKCGVQLCLDVCVPGFTDLNSTALISAPEASYKVSIMSAPEGYMYDPDEVYVFEDGSISMTITLKKG